MFYFLIICSCLYVVSDQSGPSVVNAISEHSEGVKLPGLDCIWKGGFLVGLQGRRSRDGEGSAECLGVSVWWP